MTVDGLLRNVYDSNQPHESTLLDAQITLLDAAGAITPISDAENKEIVSNVSKRTVDDVWREIVAGKTQKKEFKQEVSDEMMTLEDFLAKAEAVEEEDVKVKVVPVYSNEIVVAETSFVGGKRRAVYEPMDKAAQQRQRRMIKNRESAARSRERKQAYQVELESLAVKLEEENEQLLKEKAERTKERFKQLMWKIMPVVEKRRPARVLRRVRSMHW